MPGFPSSIGTPASFVQLQAALSKARGATGRPDVRNGGEQFTDIARNRTDFGARPNGILGPGWDLANRLTQRNMQPAPPNTTAPVGGQPTGFQWPGTQSSPVGTIGGYTPGFGEPVKEMPAYKTGGMVGPQGSPIRPGVGVTPQGQSGGAQPGMEEAQIRDLLSSNPQLVPQIQQAIQQAVQSGELTPQELNMAVQLARAALNDPSIYPQIRQFAIQQGLATEQDLPMEYDQGLVYVLLAAGQAIQAGQQQAPQGAAPQSAPAQGMPQQASGQGGGVPIMAHENEYVVPSHVVQMKGKEFFDNLVKKYDPNAQQN